MRGWRSAKFALAAAIVAVLFGALAANALAARGSGARFLSCLSGDSDVKACALIPNAESHGIFSGLGTPADFAITPDGKALYTVGRDGSTLGVFDRDAASGALTYKSCFTGDDFNDSCTKLPGARANAISAPLSSPTAIALSADGRSVYVTSGSFHGAQVAHFQRDPATNTITYSNCITGDLGAGPAGTGACTPIPSATGSNNIGGFGSGLDAASGATVSADGRFVFVTAADDDAVTTLLRNPASGDLSFGSCISDVPTSAACSHMPVEKSAALQGARAPLISHDGKNLWVPAQGSGAISTFHIGSVTGSLIGAGCISAGRRLHGCNHPENPKGFGALSAPVRLIESPDGKFVYSASKYGQLGTYKPGNANGALHLRGCLTGANEKPLICTPTRHTGKFAYRSGVAGLVDLAFGDPKGRKLYGLARTDAAIDLFKRNPGSGKVSLAGCSSALTQLGPGRRGSGACKLLSNATKGAVGSGLYKPSAFAIVGSKIYVTAARDSAVATLQR